MKNHGGLISMQIDDKAFQERLALCKHSFIAQLILLKGDSPPKLGGLNDKLNKVWNLQTWKLISLRKCYFHVLLYLEVDNKGSGHWVRLLFNRML